jgi:zinc transport system substrate-binding protein
VTNFALYDIAKQITQEKVEVKKLIPFGVEMHTYMPSVKTMTELSKAEIFIFNGLGVEPWIKKEYPNQLDMSKFVTLREADGEACEGHGEQTHEHHHEDELDPHYWLDIDNMITMTETIAQKLSKHFPAFKSLFETNAKAYIQELKKLDQEYIIALKNCRHKEIVVNHNAFGYLGAKYGFSSHSITGLSPDEQASAKKMREITDLVKEEDIKVVFFESFVSPEVAKTISHETGAQAQSLQPLANVNRDEEAQGYIGLMRENLQKLKIAMECQ